jgi:flagellar protein FliS
MNHRTHAALNQYQTTNNSSIVLSDPHSLILRLMEGAIERIYQAKGAIKQKNVANKGSLIGKAIGIISGLDACLDRELKGDLTNNLEALYEYMNRRLLEASVENDVDKLDEVARLMNEVKAGWIQIPNQLKLAGVQAK